MDETTMTPDHVIAGARLLLETYGWTQGKSKRLNGSMCITQALFEAAFCDGSMYYKVAGVLAERAALPQPASGPYAGRSLIKWNDYYRRTFDEVLALLFTPHSFGQATSSVISCIDCGLEIDVWRGDASAARLSGPCSKRKEATA